MSLLNQTCFMKKKENKASMFFHKTGTYVFQNWPITYYMRSKLIPDF